MKNYRLDTFGELDDTIRSHFETMYRKQRLRGRSESYVRVFRINLDHFDRVLCRPAVLSDLTDATISDVMEWFTSNGRSARTANKFRDQICALWRFLSRKGIVEKWPEVQELPEPEQKPVAWLRPQLARLWEACEAQTGTMCGVTAADWWLALHAVIWNTGERIGATLAICGECVVRKTDSGSALSPSWTLWNRWR